jgi:hypothetical protein
MEQKKKQSYGKEQIESKTGTKNIGTVEKKILARRDKSNLKRNKVIGTVEQKRNKANVKEQIKTKIHGPGTKKGQG